MPRYISLSEYGTGHSRKNMRNYGNDYMQSYQNYHKFMEYLRNLETYKEEFKGKIPYFWGMRKNWFPLVILDKYVARHGIKAHQERLDCGVLFMALLHDSDACSFYLDSYEVVKPNSTLRICYRAKHNQKMAIHRIMGLFNLQFRIDER